MSGPLPLPLPPLDERYTRERGPVLLTGIQALVRLPLDQRRRDRAAGLRTAGFISGYRGSPLAGYDQQLWRARELLRSHQIHFQPGLNENLAADAVWGSQQTELFPGARYEGVFSFWYGKAPGLDQAGDAIRHGSAAGSAPHGGVLLIVGDDHACKSSTFPSQSEYALMDLEVPVLSPSGVEEALRFGLLGIALSRFSGAWSALIALTDVMDSSETVWVSPDMPRIVLPDSVPEPPGGRWIRLHDTPTAQEERVREWKLPAALAFARENGINRIALDAPRARLGLVTSGKSYLELRQALRDLGIDEAAAAELGLRILKIGMPWPLEPEIVQRFARGLEEIVVIEEKRPLIETQIRDILYASPASERPRVLGKRDESGAPLVPAVYELDSARIARVVDARLASGVPSERGQRYLAHLEAREHEPTRSFPVHAPYFCSGCPHNTSTRVPEGSRALVGIGCHYMVQWMDRSSATFSQMGGEGIAWLGQAPFTDEGHVFVNLGDGTYQHSGILAIRAAVAAGVSMTYKLLVNDAVAMTGGQAVDGAPDVPQLTHQLAAEGVRRIVIVSPDPDRFSQSALAHDTETAHRDQLDAVQRDLRVTPGVTALVYDQTCAAELRRKRKRGLIEDPDRHVVINERVCEGCGDCVVASNCLSVEPVQTPFGIKRHINQSSCNKDESCLKGLCPSFAVVTGGRLRRAPPLEGEAELENLPLPEPLEPGETWNGVLAGVGGAGVTTAAAVLSMAAHLEGKRAAALDMTGLAQKGGSVLSHLRIAPADAELWGPRVPQASADVLLAFDALVGVSAAIRPLVHPELTRAVANERTTASAELVLEPERSVPSASVLATLERTCSELHAIDALGMTERLFGESLCANMMLLGFSFQKGLIPLGLESIERAIELNGAAVDSNRRAFAWGRLAGHDEKRVRDLLAPAPPEPEPAGLEALVAQRSSELTRYQSAAYARRYRALLERVQRAEQALGSAGSRLTETVARSYFQLLAYKDEYEVARLYTSGEFEAKLREQFEGDFRVELQLAPPLWAARDPDTGRLRKRSYGPWIRPLFWLLARLRFLRGSPFDPFGHLPERRAERAWIRRYEKTVETLLQGLRSENLELARQIAALPQDIRGYDLVKQRNAERVEAREAELLKRFRERPATDRAPDGDRRRP